MNSRAYQAVSFNYVAKGWYKNMKWSEVRKSMTHLEKLVKSRSTNINFKRVYLEQPNKIRPLGVPTLT